MSATVQNFIQRRYTIHLVPDFHHAPSDWSREIAEELAHAEGLTLTAAHWQVAQALQQISARGGDHAIYAHELRDVLDAHFHPIGLAIAQGRLPAELEPAAGT